jgi:hypothetical protein
MCSTVVVFTQRADREFSNLSKSISNNKERKTLLNGIERKIEQLKEDVHCGQQVITRLIPNDYLREYRLENLYRIELPNFWRMLYTIAELDDGNVVFIIDILDHKRYSKKFGYKR